MTNMDAGAEGGDQLVATISKNSREELRVSLNRWKGFELLNFRIWYDAGGGEWRPGKSGFAIRIEQISELAVAIDAARARLKAREAAA